jgi:hypothetical protein
MSYENNIADGALKSNSYSDLFEDFFRTDATIPGQEQTNREEMQDVSSFNSCDLQMASNAMLNDFYIQQQQQQQQQFQQVEPYLLQQAQMQTMQTNSFPIIGNVSVGKPGFIRNRTRKNIRQKSVAAAVKANQMLASANGIDFNSAYSAGYMMNSNFQQASQIPFYNAQIQQLPIYPPPISHTQINPPVLLAKSPVVSSTTKTTSIPSSPTARSPTSTTSEYIKLRLQQKIRSRMVSKGQIPPNPTEEELRMCGVQFSCATSPTQQQQQQQQQMQLPTPNSSPQQVPRTFNSAAYIAAPLQQQQQQVYQQNGPDDFSSYINFNDQQYSQKDPLIMMTNANVDNNPLILQNKQKASQVASKCFKQTPSNDPPQSLQQDATINYDQFFSDFILY